MRVFERSASVGPRWRRPTWAILTSLAVTGMAIVVTACGGGDNSDSPSSKAATAKKSGPASGPLTVWVDSVRQPVAKAYAKAHPDVDLKIVTFDGDGDPGRGQRREDRPPQSTPPRPQRPGTLEDPHTSPPRVTGWPQTSRHR